MVNVGGGAGHTVRAMAGAVAAAAGLPTEAVVEQPVDDGPRPRPLERFLSDDDAVAPDGEAIQSQELMRMKEAFSDVLTDRQQFVLTRRYGLDDGEFRTLSEVGKEMGLSRERVRQIEREALLKMRDQSSIRDKLSDR